MRAGAALFGVLWLATSCAAPTRTIDEPVIRVSAPGMSSSGAAVASKGQRVAVTWVGEAAGATNVFAAISNDGGATFGDPVRVNDIDGDARAGGEQAPRVAIGDDIVVAWVSKRDGVNRVRLSRSTDGGRTFQSASTPHADALTGARGWASLALDAAQGVHVAWLDGRNADATHTMAGMDHHAASTATRAPMRQDVFHAVRRADGSVGESPVATDVCFCCKTSMAVGPDGSVYVAWRHIYPTNLRDMAVARSTDGGLTFGPPTRVSEDHWQIAGCPEDGPSMAVDGDGVIHIAWPTLLPGTETRKAIFYSTSTDGGQTFAPRQRIDVDRDEVGGGVILGAAHPQLMLANDRIVITWDDSANGARRVRLRRGTRDPRTNTATFTSPTVVSRSGTANYPAVANTSTALIVAWSEKQGPRSEVVVRRQMHGR